MATILSPTEERREEIVSTNMERINSILEFRQELEEHITAKISGASLQDLGSLAIALEAIESEVVSAAIALDSSISLCQETIILKGAQA